MFERYTEKARRVIFFARYEASQFGSPHIETEHILLGLLREDKALRRRLRPPPISATGLLRACSVLS
jgi:ATP-dependent Clp protease ATP-binding subunit ClpC